MEGYELWNAVMYGVGVFVTCNVGGQLLLRLCAVRKRPAAADCKPVRAGVRADERVTVMAYGGELVKVRGGQSFEDIQRQIFADVQRQKDADAPNAPDAHDETGRRTDGGLAPKEADAAPVEAVTETAKA